MLLLSAALEVVQLAFASIEYTEVAIGKFGISAQLFQGFHSSLKLSKAHLPLINSAIPQEKKS